MCNAKPGARCAPHTRERISQLQDRIHQRLSDPQSMSSSEGLTQLNHDTEQLERAQWDYAATYEGMSDWTEKANDESATPEERHRAKRMMTAGRHMAFNRHLQVALAPRPDNGDEYSSPQKRDAALDVGRLRDQLAYDDTALEVLRQRQGEAQSEQERNTLDGAIRTIARRREQTLQRTTQLSAEWGWSGGQLCPSCGQFGHDDCFGEKELRTEQPTAVTMAVTRDTWNSHVRDIAAGHGQDVAGTHAEAIAYMTAHGHRQCPVCGQLRSVRADNHACPGVLVQRLDDNAVDFTAPKPRADPEAAKAVDVAAATWGYTTTGEEYRLCPNCAQFGHPNCYGERSAYSNLAQQGAIPENWNYDSQVLRLASEGHYVEPDLLEQAQQRHAASVQYMRERNHAQCPDCGQFVRVKDGLDSHRPVCRVRRAMEADPAVAMMSASPVPDREPAPQPAPEPVDPNADWDSREGASFDELMSPADTTKPAPEPAPEPAPAPEPDPVRSSAAYQQDRARLGAMRPDAIDGEAASLHQQRADARAGAERAEKRLQSIAAETRLQVSGPEELQQAIETDSRLKRLYGKDVDKLRKSVDGYREEEQRLSDRLTAYNDEHADRGWNRAFLVASGTGHVHSNMDCSTCNREGKATSFSWMTNYSGKSEQEIVDAAGYRACTVCYPSAPVGDEKTLPTKMFSEEELRKKEAAQKRELAAQQRREKDRAAAIANPDGSPLRDASGRAIKSERTAITAAVDALYYRHNPDSHTSKDDEDYVQAAAEAMAAKHGRNVSDVVQEWKEKAQKKTIADIVDLQAKIDSGHRWSRDDISNRSDTAAVRRHVDSTISLLAKESGRDRDDVAAEVAKKAARKAKKK